MDRIAQKIFAISVILMISISFPVFAQVAVDSLFTKANSFYKQKEYFEAIDTYTQITKLGYKSAELYFNIANAYYKTGDYPRAVLNYERALLLNPSDEDIEFNLAKSKTYVVDKIEEIPDFFIKTWIRKLLTIFKSDLWAIISLGLVFSGLILLISYFLTTRIQLKKPAFALGVAFLILALFSYLFAIKTKNYIEESDAAIVLEPVVRVKSSPDSESTDMFIIHEGSKAYVLREIDNWVEIKLDDGKQGWIESSAMEKI